MVMKTYAVLEVNLTITVRNVMRITTKTSTIVCDETYSSVIKKKLKRKIKRFFPFLNRADFNILLNCFE
jgi:hypothetical protein